MFPLLSSFFFYTKYINAMSLCSGGIHFYMVEKLGITVWPLIPRLSISYMLFNQEQQFVEYLPRDIFELSV